MRHSRVVLPVVLAALAACGKDAAAPGTALYGTYGARTVNGQALPATLGASPDRSLELVAATLAVRADGTWALVDDLRSNSFGTMTAMPDSSSGSWTTSGTQVTFIPTHYGLLNVRTMSWHDGRLTLTDVSSGETVRVVFVK